MHKNIHSGNEFPASTASPQREPSEDEVRDYAYHLYEQSHCKPGHDLENWLEAAACLKANIPAADTHQRLHRHVETLRGGQTQTLRAPAPPMLQTSRFVPPVR